jgi:hypothetical protein
MREIYWQAEELLGCTPWSWKEAANSGDASAIVQTGRRPASHVFLSKVINNDTEFVALCPTYTLRHSATKLFVLIQDLCGFDFVWDEELV